MGRIISIVEGRVAARPSDLSTFTTVHYHMLSGLSYHGGVLHVQENGAGPWLADNQSRDLNNEFW